MTTIRLRVGAIGAASQRWLASLGSALVLVWMSTISVMRTPGSMVRISRHAASMTLASMLPVFIVLFAVGALLSLQSLLLLRGFGVEQPLAPMAAAAIVREMAPGFSAVMCAMQAGAGVAAALASMGLREELSALAVMGVDRRGLLLGPRMLGMAIAAPLLNALAIAAGLAGATMMAVTINDLPRQQFIDGLLAGLTVRDVVLSEAKAVLFGLIIGVVCVQAGLRPALQAADIGLAATRSVVGSVIVVLMANYLINTLVLGVRGGP